VSREDAGDTRELAEAMGRWQKKVAASSLHRIPWTTRQRLQERAKESIERRSML
jgi:hypothetical protein